MHPRQQHRHQVVAAAQNPNDARYTVVVIAGVQAAATRTAARAFAARGSLDGEVVILRPGKTRSVAHLATTMTANISENYGQLQVTETGGGKAVGKAYVKVYARLADGSVKFHKDGYTDLRGRFDYASVNTPERQAIEKFAVLVLSEDRGAVIREVAPPQK